MMYSLLETLNKNCTHQIGLQNAHTHAHYGKLFLSSNLTNNRIINVFLCLFTKLKIRRQELM